MCTVTFVPTKNGFVFTSNRDESVKRLTSEKPSFTLINKKKVLYPKDGYAGGSWITISESGSLVCLLNGAFEKHKHEPPYRKSRGLVVLDFYQFNGFNHFIAQYEFEGIEPFTMVVIENQKLYEFRWDGTTKHSIELSTKTQHIWSSCTLYSREIQEQRKLLFNKSFQNSEEVLEFHSSSFDLGYENGFLLKRKNGVETVSQTQLVFENQKIDYYHHNLATNVIYSDSFYCSNLENVL